MAGHAPTSHDLDLQEGIMNEMQQLPRLSAILPPKIDRTLHALCAATQAPEGMILSMMLSVISAVAMRRFRVRLNNKSSPVSLSTLILADVNERKSTVEFFVTRVLRDFEKATANSHANQFQVWKSQIVIHNAKVKGVKQALAKATSKNQPTVDLEMQLSGLLASAPPEPKQVRLLLSHTTLEGAIRFLSEQGGYAFWSVADGGIFFDSRAATHAAGLADLWSGVPPNHNTKTDGQSKIENVNIASCIAVQPEVFKDFLHTKRGKRWLQTGLISRFLISHPQSTQGHRNTNLLLNREPDIGEYEARLRELLTESETTGISSPNEIEFTNEALETLSKFNNAIEQELVPEGHFTDMPGAAGKMLENVSRIAATLHIFEGFSGQITRDTTVRAIQLGEIYLAEHKRLLGEIPFYSVVERAANALVHYIRKHQIGQEPILLRSLSNKGPPALRDPVIREAALRLCYSRCWIYFIYGIRNTTYVAITQLGTTVPLLYPRFNLFPQVNHEV